jgi:diguanylate cyclase (GGDEF)-like protein
MRTEHVDFERIIQDSQDNNNDILGGVSQVEDNDLAEQEILDVLHSRYWLLKFPPHLEEKYRNQSITRSLTLFHFRVPFLFFLFLVELIGIVHVLPAEIYLRYLSVNSWVGVFVMISWIFSYLAITKRRYDWYIGISGTIAVALNIASANMGGGESVILTHAGIIYSVIVVYSFIRLRFQTAMICGWLGGALGLMLAFALDQKMNWSLFNLTYTTTSMLGMFLAYSMDRQERTNFLQACLLQQSVIKGKNLAQKLDILSRQDALTCLANRRHLNEMMHDEWNRALRQQQSLVLMIVDVDYFKNYNDKLGHVAGDECLRNIGQLILSLVKRSGELAARYGGEEFVLMFPSMGGDIAELQAQRLLDHLAGLKLKNPDDDREYVTVSIGVAVGVPTTGMCVEQLLRQADAALYKAKANGRNRYEFFDDAMRTETCVHLHTA